MWIPSLIVLGALVAGAAAVFLLRRRGGPWEQCVQATATALGVSYIEGTRPNESYIDSEVAGLRVGIRAVPVTARTSGPYQTKLTVAVPGGEGLSMAAHGSESDIELLPGERSLPTGDDAFDKEVTVLTLDAADALSRLDYLTRSQVLDQVRAGWRFDHGSWVFVQPLLETEPKEIIDRVQPCLGAARALQAVHPDGLKRLVGMGRQDPNPAVRRRVVGVLLELEAPVSDLAAFLADREPSVVKAAAQALGARGDASGLEPLKHKLDRTDDPALRATLEGVYAELSAATPAPASRTGGTTAPSSLLTPTPPPAPRRRSLIQK